MKDIIISLVSFTLYLRALSVKKLFFLNNLTLDVTFSKIIYVKIWQSKGEF